MKLICLTYAGGNKYSYRDFEPYLNKTIDFITLELPGRGGRVTEPLQENLLDLIDDLYDQILPYTTSDYMIYGHSMGGMLGNLLIHKLRDELYPLPLHFLVTGCSSPKKRSQKRKLHQLNETDFKEAIRELGGMPDEVMESKGLMDFVIPILRSDIRAIETNVYRHRDKYNVPMTVICGTEEGLSEDEIISWQEETSAKFNHFLLPGGHFFIQDNQEIITDLINVHLLKKNQVTCESIY